MRLRQCRHLGVSAHVRLNVNENASDKANDWLGIAPILHDDLVTSTSDGFEYFEANSDDYAVSAVSKNSNYRH